MNVSFDYICYMIFKKNGTLPVINKYRSVRNLAIFKLDLGKREDYVVEDYGRLKIDVNSSFIIEIYTESFERTELLKESIRKEFNELINNKMKYLKYLIFKLKNNEVLDSTDRDILINIVNEYVENNYVNTFKISGDIVKLERKKK